MKSVSINSEIGKLEKVIIHRPGVEIEKMTPRTAINLLYDDILDLELASKEHDELTGILKLHAQVYEMQDLLAEILRKVRVKEKLLQTLIPKMEASPAFIKELMTLPAEELAFKLFTGVPQKKNSLEKFLSDQVFALPPLPNFIYTRDSAIIINEYAVTGSMANKIRISESLIAEHIFSFHDDMLAQDFYFDGTVEDESITIEGGDILILREDVLAIGLSERTTPSAVDSLVKKFKAKGKIKHIFAVILPKERAMIHLDMLFTMVDKHYAVVHKPYILGNNHMGVVHMDLRNEEHTFEYIPCLLKGLKRVGIELEPVICGGDDLLTQEREQWMAGANFFTMAPGKAIGYGRNAKTFENLEKTAGMIRLEAKDVLAGKVHLEDYDRYAIAIAGAELSRGGGGARCMTMPVLRQPVEW